MGAELTQPPCPVNVCVHFPLLLLQILAMGSPAVSTDDSSSVLTASFDCTAKIWSSSTGECTQTFTGHGGWVNSAVFSADESSVLTALRNGTAKIWSSSTGKCTQTF